MFSIKRWRFIIQMLYNQGYRRYKAGKNLPVVDYYKHLQILKEMNQ